MLTLIVFSTLLIYAVHLKHENSTLEEDKKKLSANLLDTQTKLTEADSTIKSLAHITAPAS